MSEFTTKNTTELKKLLSEKRHALHTFRFSLVGGKAKNVKEGRAVRKDIARIMTAMTVQKSAKTK